VYLDDLSWFVELTKITYSNCGKLFQRFRVLSLEKCQLSLQEVLYLWHVELPEGINTDPENLKAVRGWPITKNNHEIKRFLNPCIYYKRFISGLADVAKPLTKLTEEKQPFNWTTELGAVFQIRKKAFCIASILPYPQPRKRLVVDGVKSQLEECSPKYRSDRRELEPTTLRCRIRPRGGRVIAQDVSRRLPTSATGFDLG
jgi:hypothetical protein